MRTDAYVRNVFTGDYWNFVEVSEGTTVTNKYSLVRTIQFRMGANAGERTKIYSRFPLRLGSRIRDVYDSNSNPVMTQFFWQVSSINPIFDVFGKVVSYEHTTIKFPISEF